jgi:hypothetical protein
VGKQEDVESESREDFGAVLGEYIRVHASVISDDDRGSFLSSEEVLGKSVSRLVNEQSIHAVRASAELTAQPRCSERQAGIKPIVQFGNGRCVTRGGSVDDCAQFVNGLAIGILRKPRLGAPEKVSIRHGYPFVMAATTLDNRAEITGSASLPAAITSA